MQLEMYGRFKGGQYEPLFVFQDENMIHTYFGMVDKSKYDEVIVVETDIGKMPILKFSTEIEHYGKVRRR